MPYWRIRFRVSDELSGALGDRLTELGAFAVTFENAGPDAFYEAAYPQQPSWADLNVTGLFERAIDIQDIVRRVQSWHDQPIPFETSELEDQDWERCWLSGFHPIQFGAGLWVCPSWAVPPAPDAVNLILDPGLAFGTGTHPTTAMCLSWLDRHPPQGKKVVDYGCGSGILAIASLMLGASHAWGVDVDPRALAASAHNAERNRVADRLTVCAAGDLPEHTKADLVMANILAEVLIELSGRLISLLRHRGVILLTGILPAQEAEVRDAFSSCCEFERAWHDGWLMLIGQKTGTPGNVHAMP